ncbi:hypothetical protein AAFP30_02440 [Gordonia sp. CPCC 205515]|uniref:hypothetical protein n=1 Tax=Gordonia sp. CPCC 205515 TaxID=3140791 RepID=UPI003AF3C2CD
MTPRDHRLRNFEVDTLRVGDTAPETDPARPRCTSTSFTGAHWWLCDRADEHTGEHATISFSGLVLATWIDGDFDALLTDSGRS